MIVLPGVPAEMKEMWHGSVDALLREAGGGRQVVRHRRIKKIERLRRMIAKIAEEEQWPQ